MTMQKEYKLNRKWITDNIGENIGETNFVITEEFLLEHGKECPNYDDEENIENFLETYVPEEDGQYLYNLAKNTGSLIEDIGEVFY